MCGIAGMIDLRGHGRANDVLVHMMTQRFAHRGPDGDGFYSQPNATLGMRRLSIIDLEGSDQPLYNEDEQIALVFNGEIYNFLELRADLMQRGHTFNTAGDGETINHLYEDLGLDFFGQLRGMYSIALWDAPRQRLVLAVDHIGMKPLYLLERDGMLYFASEIKAFFVLPDIQAELNLDVLDTYFSFGFPIGAETLFAGIRRLMPGHYLVAEQGTYHIAQHWAWGHDYNTETIPTDEAQIIQRVHDQLRESVHIHTRSDVPVGLFLSGGVDSAGVLALMHEQNDRIQTYTVGFAGNQPDNEVEHARRIATHFNTQHHERIITAQDWWAGLHRYAYHHDEPNANPSAISMMLLAEHTARDVKVVQTGLGGDELFGGYMHHHAIPRLLQQQRSWGKMPLAGIGADGLGKLEHWYPAFKRWRVIGAIPTYAPRIRHALMPGNEGIRRMMSYDGMVMSDAIRRQLYNADVMQAWQQQQHKEHTYQNIIARSAHANDAKFAQALVINTWLMGNALLSQDKVTMAHSLEARVPLFDPKLMALSYQLPSTLMLKGNKYILREALRPLLPDFALERPKQPFGTPIRGWLRHDLVDSVREVLYDPSALSQQLFLRKGLMQILEGHFRGHARQEEIIFRLLNFELWWRAFQQDARTSKHHDA